MGHPHNEHRAHKVEKSRVHRLCGGKGYASGGAVKEEVAEKALSSHKAEHEALKAKGGKPKHRMDKPRRAKGGRVKHKHSGKTSVNVIVAPKSDAPGGAPMAGVAPPHPPMAAAPPPAAAIPPAPPPAMAKPPMPPIAPGGAGGPMPMRKRGGAVEAGNAKPPGAKSNTLAGPSTDKMGTIRGAEKAARGELTAIQRKRGGKVDCSQGMTPVQHSGNKDDMQNIGRKKPITYAKGGKVDPIKKGGEHMYTWAQHNESHEGGGDKPAKGKKQYADGWDEHTKSTLSRAKHQRKTGGPVYANGMEGEGMGPNFGAGANSGLGRLRKVKEESKYNRV